MIMRYHRLIGWLQQQKDIALEMKSDIEFIYLPMLDEYSEVKTACFKHPVE